MQYLRQQVRLDRPLAHKQARGAHALDGPVRVRRENLTQIVVRHGAAAVARQCFHKQQRQTVELGVVERAARARNAATAHAVANAAAVKRLGREFEQGQRRRRHGGGE
jgi:hypothetical protein